MSIILKRISSVGFGNILGQVIALLSLPIIARLYSPESYAIWMIFFSIVLIFSLIATLRFELAILLPKKHAEAIPIFALCLIFTIVFSLLSLLVTVLLGNYIYGESSTELSALSPLTMIMVLSSGIYSASLSWLTRTKSFNWYSAGCFGLPFSTVFSQLVLGYSGNNNHIGLITGGVLGQALMSTILLSVVISQIVKIKTPITKKSIITSFKRYQNYPKYMTPLTLIGTIRTRMVYFLLGIHSNHLSGLYGMAFKISNAPNSFFTGAVRPVFFQWAAEKDFRNMEKTISSIIKIMVIIIIPFWLIFVYFSEPIITIIFGEQWREASEYVVILSFPAVALLLTNWLDRGFDVLNQQKTAFQLEAIFSSLVITILITGFYLFENMKHVIMLQATTMLGYYWFWLYVLFKKAAFPTKVFIKILSYYTGTSLFFSLLFYLITLSFSQPISFILMLSSALLIIYFQSKKRIIFLLGNI